MELHTPLPPLKQFVKTCVKMQKLEISPSMVIDVHPNIVFVTQMVTLQWIVQMERVGVNRMEIV